MLGEVGLPLSYAGSLGYTVELLFFVSTFKGEISSG